MFNEKAPQCGQYGMQQLSQLDTNEDNCCRNTQNPLQEQVVTLLMEHKKKWNGLMVESDTESKSDTTVDQKGYRRIEKYLENAPSANCKTSRPVIVISPPSRRPHPRLDRQSETLPHTANL